MTKPQWVMPEKKKPLTRQELDRGGCDAPGCTCSANMLYLHQRCHLGKGLNVRYEKATGVLTVFCKVCDAVVAELAVKDAHDQPKDGNGVSEQTAGEPRLDQNPAGQEG